MNRCAVRQRYTDNHGTRAKPQRQGKTRICIRLPDDLLEHFKREAAKTVHSVHPLGYQGLIVESLRRDIDTQEYLDSLVRDEQKHALV